MSYEIVPPRINIYAIGDRLKLPRQKIKIVDVVIKGSQVTYSYIKVLKFGEIATNEPRLISEGELICLLKTYCFNSK